MKKILFFICLLFFTGCVKALEPTMYYQENIYSNRVGDENKIWSGKMAFIFMNGQIVYCLDPYLIVGSGYNVSNSYYIKPNDLEYYSLVAYYGYNLTNRNNIYYYMAAQELIWERIIGKGNVFWTTGQYNTGNRIDISLYKKEIENDIANFNLMPKIANKHLLSSFDNLLLIDDNKVLNNYSVSSIGLSEIIKNGNSLNIKMRDIDRTIISFERRIKNNIETKIYQANNAQTLGQFGTNIKRSFSIQIILDYFKTNVYINFYDNVTKEKLDNIEFSICDMDAKIDKMDQGYKIENIKEGKYWICGLDGMDQELSFEITKDNYIEDTYIDIYIKQKEDEILKKDKIEDNLNKSAIIKESNIEESIVEENKKIIPELPNTYDYETPIYLTLLLIIIGSVFYKIK